MEPLKEYVRSKLPIFDPPPPLSHCCLFVMYPSTDVHFSELLPCPSQKRLYDIYDECSNKKSGSEKREKK